MGQISCRSSTKKRNAPGNQSKATPTKKDKNQLKIDLQKVSSIVKSNLKKHLELENQRNEEQFLKALQYQDKLQRMQMRNKEIR